MAADGLFELPPVMIYGEDLTHIVTEKGIAYLSRCSDRNERRAAIRAIAGRTPVGAGEMPEETEQLRRKRAVCYPEDLGIPVDAATRDLLAARRIADLVEISGGLYQPAPRFL
jgi:malonate decarboxylase alpha subunit